MTLAAGFLGVACLGATRAEEPRPRGDVPEKPGAAAFEPLGEALGRRVAHFEMLDDVTTPSDGAVDLVQLRLLRMETRRWQMEAGRNGGMMGPARNPDPDVAGAEPIIPAEDSFEDWAFGGTEGAKRFRQQLDKLLEKKLREVEQIFLLTDAQKRKLKLAGKGDLQRLLDIVEDAHREFDHARTEASRLVELQKQLRLVDVRVSEGPFEMGSLFSKTLRKLYDADELRRRPTGPRK
jgi:hypothetical protein